MSLQLLHVTTDKHEKNPDNSEAGEPQIWTAKYQTQFSTNEAMFWSEVTVSKNDRGYTARVELETPHKLTMRGSLLKLAEWARAMASGIEECAIPEEGFPMLIEKRS